MSKVEVNNNELWMVTIDNVYSFDSLEKRSFLTFDEKEARTYFKKIIKDYISNELEVVSDLLGKKFMSLNEIIKYIEKINENEFPLYLNTTQIHDIRYNYGLNVNKEKTYALFTISKYTKEILDKLDNMNECHEDYYIILQKVKLGEEVVDYGLPVLDNVKEIDEILENL